MGVYLMENPINFICMITGGKEKRKSSIVPYFNPYLSIWRGFHEWGYAVRYILSRNGWLMVGTPSGKYVTPQHRTFYPFLGDLPIKKMVIFHSLAYVSLPEAKNLAIMLYNPMVLWVDLPMGYFPQRTVSLPRQKRFSDAELMALPLGARSARSSPPKGYPWERDDPQKWA